MFKQMDGTFYFPLRKMKKESADLDASIKGNLEKLNSKEK